MRLSALAVLLAVSCMGIEGWPVEPVPSDPPPDAPPQPSTAGYVWGHVVNDSGVCIAGAVVQILEGPGAGRSMEQDGACDAWSYAAGFAISDVTLGAKLKIGATADGYLPQEVDIVVGSGGPPVTFVLERK